MPNNCFRAVLRVARGERQQAPMCSQGWAGTVLQPLLGPGSYNTKAMQALALSSTCFISAAMFFSPAHSPGCAACPLQSCKHSTIQAGFSLCSCSLRNLSVAAGGGIRLRALTTLGAFGKFSSHSLASSNPGSLFYLWVYFLDTTTYGSGLWCPPDHGKM